MPLIAKEYNLTVKKKEFCPPFFFNSPSTLRHSLYPFSHIYCLPHTLLNLSIRRAHNNQENLKNQFLYLLWFTWYSSSFMRSFEGRKTCLEKTPKNLLEEYYWFHYASFYSLICELDVIGNSYYWQLSKVLRKISRSGAFHCILRLKEVKCITCGYCTYICCHILIMRHSLILVCGESVA